MFTDAQTVFQNTDQGIVNDYNIIASAFAGKVIDGIHSVVDKMWVDLGDMQSILQDLFFFLFF